MRTGLLLINLGTPDAPTTGAVRRYLREFLSDPRVLDINPIGRALLLNLIILPRRPAKSAHAYASIWDVKRGSPLLYHSRDLAAAVGGEVVSIAAWLERTPDGPIVPAADAVGCSRAFGAAAILFPCHKGLQ